MPDETFAALQILYHCLKQKIVWMSVLYVALVKGLLYVDQIKGHGPVTL